MNVRCVTAVRQYIAALRRLLIMLRRFKLLVRLEGLLCAGRQLCVVDC